MSVKNIIRKRYIFVLGAQLSSHCLSIDGFISKCWSILTYPKFHELSLDEPFLHISDFVLASYTFGCVEISDFVPNNCHFQEVSIFFSFEENGGWSASRAPKRLRRCCSKWKTVPWLLPSLQRQWFWCWRPSAWRKAKNLRRRWCYLLWAVETERNHHWETVSNAIDTFEPGTARKMATMRAEERKSDSTAWERSALRCQTRYNLPGNAQMGTPTLLAVFPDIASSDYYLFRSMAHGLADQQFRSYEDIEKWLHSWIASKDEHFYRNGIRALPEKWQKL